jgi:hypothetical protein
VRCVSFCFFPDTLLWIELWPIRRKVFDMKLPFLGFLLEILFDFTSMPRCTISKKQHLFVAVDILKTF